jgi:putative two-component system response regulator
VKAPARHHVLIVDDEPGVLASLRATLEHTGYQVTCTSSLQAGIQALCSSSFQVVLTDLYLGEDDLGYQLAELARTRMPPVPVVLLTGRPSFDSAQEALRSKVAEFVVKPVDPIAILTTVRRIIQESELTSRNQELEVQNQILASVLPRAIEVKDPTTSGHAERVIRYADVLSRRCGVSDEDRASLRLAAQLHDVGKIGIPETILCKPGPLTADEREIIQRHPAMGYSILEPLKNHAKVREWVYQHHERWDGKGYPQGLHGEEVDLPGRILVLAEVYDALAEQRSYKQAWAMPRIVAFFRDQAGRQFDPDLARIVADGLERMGNRYFAADPGMLF